MKKNIYSLLIPVFLGFALSLSQTSSAQFNNIDSVATNLQDTLRTVFFVDADHGFAAGDNGKVIKTTDGGDSWTEVSISSTGQIRDIHFLDQDKGWAVMGDLNNSETSGELWKTVNGGQSWDKVTYTSTRARMGICFADTNTGWACGSRNGPIDIANTTNGGDNWTEQTSSSIFGWTYKVDATSKTDVWAAAVTFFPSASGMILHSSNGGSQWNQISTGTIAFTYGIEALDDQMVFAVGSSGLLMSTTNGGSNWTNHNDAGSTDLWAVSFLDKEFGVVCGDDGMLLSTSDSGKTWNKETNPFSEQLLDINCIGKYNAWAVGANGFLLHAYSGPVGIDKPVSQTIQVYPNPAESVVIIQTEDLLQGAELNLFDSQGRLIRNIHVSGSEIRLNTSDLISGSYFFSIISGDDNRYGRFMVK